MGAIVLDGEAVAARIRGEVAEGVERLRQDGFGVGLGTVLVGDDVPSERYVALKHQDCASVGMYSVGEHLPATASQAEVLDVIARFNADPKVSAFLVQLPLPPGLNEEQALRPGYNAAVSIVHTGVSLADMAAIVRTADIVVAAAGRPHLLTPEMVKPGAAVVSAGTTFEGKKLIPDAHPDVAEVAGWITPRLGGVGPMTRAMLLRNALRAAEIAAT
jgi:5,10-methylene-tetrahydrofolate dehydrogenase/methenyl tetrahydrofolate cyclohydrolase